MVQTDRQQPFTVVAVPCCNKFVGDRPFHVVGDKYVRAVTDGAGAMPWLVPALGTPVDVRSLVARVDGLMLTGSLSNVEPQHYGGPASDAGTLHDADRDAVTLPLIDAALAARVPVLAICRGLQELNVALGGTLHQKVHEVAGRMDHRAPQSEDMEIKFAHAHDVRLTPGGALNALTGLDTFPVNSLHWQGIDRLAPGLTVDAVAPDGQVEAVRVTNLHGVDGFALAVQWHPEWRFAEDPPSAALFRAFGDAVRRRAARRSLAAA